MARELLAMEGLLTEHWQRDFFTRMLARKSGHRPVKTMVEARLKPLGNVSSHLISQKLKDLDQQI